MPYFFPTLSPWLRRHGLTLLQVAFSLLLLARLFSGGGTADQIHRLIAAADARWLAAGLLSALGTEVLCAVRWWLLLRIFGVPVPFARACAFTLAGLFYSFTLPGAGGGDVFRILYGIRLHPGKKVQVAASVIADRLCGLMALVVALGITLSRSNSLPLDAASRATVHLSALVLSGPVIVLFLWWLTTLPGVRAFGMRWMPARLRARVLELDEGFWKITRHPRAILAAVGVSCVALAVHFVTYYFSARSLGLPVTLGGMFTIMPVVDALIMLPVTFYGLGLRETVMQHLMGSLFGVPEVAATMASLTGFGLQATVGLLGGLLLPFTLPHQENAEKEMRA